jgi:large subunit ribosomal protein L31
MWCSAAEDFAPLSRHPLEERPMKPEIHPTYDAMKATCSCGNVIQTRSTLAQDILIDVCSQCHPFYTGKQKILDTGGRVDRFKKRFGSRRV